jgi:hypothetical protein
VAESKARERQKEIRTLLDWYCFLLFLAQNSTLQMGCVLLPEKVQL